MRIPHEKTTFGGFCLPLNGIWAQLTADAVHSSKFFLEKLNIDTFGLSSGKIRPPGNSLTANCFLFTLEGSTAQELEHHREWEKKKKKKRNGNGQQLSVSNMVTGHAFALYHKKQTSSRSW